MALNPGAEASVPIYPEGMAHLTAAAHIAADGTAVRIGHPPVEPETLLRAVRDGLRGVAAVPGRASFPIDVTFPGAAEPDIVDDWVAANASSFYIRG